MDVSIIIVNYNTCDITRNCLKSIFEQTKDINFEVIVSDNGSKDGSVEMIKEEFPQVVLIENNANLGFGAANNRGLKIAKGKYIFYLNSDTILLNNAIKIFYDYWENSQEKDKIGALGGNLLNEKKEFMHSYGIFPNFLKEVVLVASRLILTFFLWLFRLKRKAKTQSEIHKYIGDVDYLTGADLFMRNNQFAFFDERFFLYYEETYLQKQLKMAGLRRILIDGPEIIHLEGQCNYRKNDYTINRYLSFADIQNELSRIKYQQYTGNKVAAFLMKVLLYLFWLIPCFKEQTKSYRKDIWVI
jgi:hypothetical protein